LLLFFKKEVGVGNAHGLKLSIGACDLTENKEPAKLWSHEFIFLLVVSFVNMGAFGMGIPIFPGYAVSLGATLSVAGIVTAMFSTTALFGRPFAGIMGDRLNKKRLLIVSLVLNGFATLLYAFVPTLALVIPIRIFHALMFSISGTVSFALGAEYIPKERMGEGVGFMGMGQIIGMAVGPNISILVAEHHSFQLSFLISGVVIMISGLMVLGLKYKQTTKVASNPKTEKPIRYSFHLKDFVAVELLPNALFAAVFMLGNGLTTSFLVMIGAERGIEGVGIFFIVNAAIVLFTRPLAGKLIDRKGVAFVVVPGFLLTAGTMLLIGNGGNVWFIALAAALFACGAGTSMPALQADCLMRLGRERGSVATGTYLIGLDIGMTVGPALGGIAADLYGFRTTFNSAAGLMTAGFVGYLMYRKWLNAKAI